MQYARASAEFDGLMAKLGSAGAIAQLAANMAALTRFSTGSFTRDLSMATGSEAVGGVGFQPKVGIFIASQGGGGNLSIGWDVETVGRSIAVIEASGAWFPSGSQCIQYFIDASNFQTAVVTSDDAGGWTFSWTKTGTPTGSLTVYYLAMR